MSPDARGSPITNYDVYWDEGAGGDPRTLLTTTVSTSFSASTTQKIADLTDGQTYKFSLIARNAIGSSAYADTAAIIAATVPDIPATPTILAANSASIEIQWAEPASGGTSITNYEVYIAVGATPSSGEFSFVADTALTRTYTKFESVTPGQYYSFKVLAKNSVGSSTLSDAVQ